MVHQTWHKRLWWKYWLAHNYLSKCISLQVANENRCPKEVVSRSDCQVSIFALQHFVDCGQIFAWL